MHFVNFDLLVMFPWVDRFIVEYPTLALIIGWATGMLSYHQDAKRHYVTWAILSQTFAGICLIALVVFGLKRGSWPNLVVAPALIWLQIQFTRRWWVRRGAWW
jgi:hypothetical protein